jgi:hypothetical protein
MPTAGERMERRATQIAMTENCFMVARGKYGSGNMWESFEYR